MHEYKIEMKLEEEMKPLKKICETLEEAVKHEFEKGIESVNVEEMGEVIDMIKDIYEAKEKLVKGCYYKQIMLATEKQEEEDKEDEKAFVKMMKEQYGMEDEDEARRFYRGQPRSRTSGRFMSRGDGRRSNSGRRGYEEMMPMDYRMDIEGYKMYPAEYWRDVDRASGRMYFSGGGSSGSSGNSGGASGQSGNSGMSGGNSGGNSGGSSRGYSEGYSDGQSRGYEEGNRRGYSEGYEQGNRDGRSQGGNSHYDRARRGYEEKKEMNKGNSPQENSENMKGLEELLNVVGGDVKELSPKMSPSEKAMAAQKFDTWSKMLKQQ